MTAKKPMTRDEILLKLQTLKSLYEEGHLPLPAYTTSKAALEASLADFPTVALPSPPTLSEAQAPQETEVWEKGRQIAGRYELHEVVGRGGMGEVWGAWDRAASTPLRVALKRLPSDLAGHPSLQERLAREIRLLRGLEHPRIIRLLDAATDYRFFVMEYLEGRTLRRQLSLGRLPLLESLRLLEEICDGLAALHNAGIVHRDLKPENLFLMAPKASVSLGALVSPPSNAPASPADDWMTGGPLTPLPPTFGAADLASAGFQVSEASICILDIGIAFDARQNAQTTTKLGKLGTPYYMAPEQLAGGTITMATDLYALGVLIYELATGSISLSGAEPLLTEIQHLHAEGQLPLSEIHDAIAPAYMDACRVLSDLAAVCQKKRPAERPTLATIHDTLVSCRKALQKARSEANAVREATLERLLLRDPSARLATFLDESHARFPENPRWLAVLPRCQRDEALIEEVAADLRARLRVEPLEGIVARWFALASKVEAKSAYLQHPFHRALLAACEEQRDFLHKVDTTAASDLSAALRLLEAPPLPADVWEVRRLGFFNDLLRREEDAKAAAERRTADAKAADAKAEVQRLETLRKQEPPGFVFCPAGSFRMGSDNSDKEAFRDEKPLRHVTLTRGFWMQATPVTQAEWQALAGFNPSSFKSSGPSAPVEKVSWYEAVWFCNKRSKKEGLPEAYRFSNLTGTPGQESFQIGGVEQVAGSTGYRLPTEAEWEYACRAGTTTERYGELDAIAWYSGNSGNQTHPVKQKQPNAWGLHDMLGNVWEWCWDWYSSSTASAQVDPAGPSSGSHRVNRGGSWSGVASCARASRRSSYAPSDRNSGLGFRLLRTV